MWKWRLGLSLEGGKNLLFCEQKRSKKNFVNLDHAGFTASG
jgi:hypothetical protein